MTMTLKLRNRVYIFLLCVSILIFIMSLVSFFYLIINNIKTPENFQKNFDLIPGLCPYNKIASFISILIFPLFASIFCFAILQGFEKTAALEIQFFTGFVISCLLESIRFFIPLFELWNSYSEFVKFIGKIIIAGRLLVPLSFLFSIIFSSSDQRQNSERNMFIMFLSAALLGFCYPINTAAITSNFSIAWGYKELFVSIRFLIFTCTVITLLQNAYISSTKEMYMKAFSSPVFFLGYALLCSTDSFLELAVSASSLVTGAIIYLSSIHRLEN